MSLSLWMSRFGLALVFCYCLAVSIFFSNFSELHLTFSFLPFPVFVGEIVLIICSVLLVFVCWKEKPQLTRLGFLLGLYFAWVIVKALVNYVQDGPLTFRNAALFYYPAFAVISYYFYQKAMVPRWVWLVLAFLGASIMFFKVMDIWFWWTYAMLIIWAIWSVRSVLWRWAGWVFLAVCFFLGIGYFYQGPRAHFVSVFFGVCFLLTYGGVALLRRHDVVRLGLLCVIFAAFMGGAYIFASHNALISLTSLNRIIALYQEKDRQYHENESAFVPRHLAVGLYNPNQEAPIKSSVASSVVASSQVSVPASAQPFSAQPSSSASAVSVEVEKVKPLIEDVLGGVLANKTRRERPLDTDEGNIVFRLLVWRDMAKELLQRKALFGFSFGHPQRSRSLEVLHWASGEWMRDGWITPHNSYFHIIYRAGVLGFVMIAGLLWVVLGLARDLFKLDFMAGALLVSALAYWMMLSNFFVILELPHNAIPFWGLLGIACAYRDSLKRHQSEGRGL